MQVITCLMYLPATHTTQHSAFSVILHIPCNETYRVLREEHNLLYVYACWT